MAILPHMEGNDELQFQRKKKFTGHVAQQPSFLANGVFDSNGASPAREGGAPPHVARKYIPPARGYAPLSKAVHPQPLLYLILS